MAAPPNRKCWSENREIHIGTCADVWSGGVFCVCNPADEAEYLDTVPLYVGASIDGVSSANIKAYFNDVLFDTYYAKKSSYIWMWADYVSNGAHGILRFDLCSGNTVIESRSTKWVGEIDPEPEPCEHGDVKTDTCEDGSKVVTHQCMPPDFVATGDTCETCERLAAKRTKTCLDGTTIATHDCVDGNWVATGAECGDGCVDGTTKTRTCADGSTIVSHECVQGVWYESDNKCPEDEEEEPECTEDEIKECADGSTIITKHCIEGVYVPTSNRCPEEPEPSKSPWVLLTVAIIGLYLYLRG